MRNLQTKGLVASLFVCVTAYVAHLCMYTHMCVCVCVSVISLHRGQDPWGVAYASCNLGLLYFEQADYEQATVFFERFFEVARTLPDKRALEAARFNLGVARGALRMHVGMRTWNICTRSRAHSRSSHSQL